MMSAAGADAASNRNRIACFTASSLESQPQAELDLPRCVGLAQHDPTEVGGRNAGARAGEYHVIGGVERLGTEREAESLRDAVGLFQRRVEIAGARIVHVGQVTAYIAEGELRRLRECRWIEVEAVVADLRPARESSGSPRGVRPHARATAE